MSTDPNFPKRDAPKLPSEKASGDKTRLPPGEEVSHASNRSESKGVEPKNAPSEDETNKHDPEKFGSFTLPPDFLKEAWSKPLPKAKEEDLAHDTLAPYRKGGEVHRQVVEDEGSAAPRAKVESRSAVHLDKGNKKTIWAVLIALGVVACFAIGGMLGIFEGEAEQAEIEVITDEGDASVEATTHAPVFKKQEAAEGEEARDRSEGKGDAAGDATRATIGGDTVREPATGPGVVTQEKPKVSEDDVPSSGGSSAPKKSPAASTPNDLSRTKPVFGGK
jgi:hypothetical protein